MFLNLKMKPLSALLDELRKEVKLNENLVTDYLILYALVKTKLYREYC